MPFPYLKSIEIQLNYKIFTYLALSDPFYENKKGLEILLKTPFVHYIDIPALSMVIPIIEYGLRSRDSHLKGNF